MMIPIPEWVDDLRRELYNKVIELGVGYRIPVNLIQDSKAIDEALDSIVFKMESIYNHSNKKPGDCLAIGDVEFGSLRKRKK
jgi:hypothetical protein